MGEAASAYPWEEDRPRMLRIQGAYAKIASMKCPACGMETSDAQEWCDFCKEPFRRKKKSEAAKAAEQPKAQPPQESPKPAVKDNKGVLTPELLAKLQAQRTQSQVVDPTRGEIPAEFLHLDTGERIPVVSPAVRKLAWGFLTIVFIWVIVFTAIILSRGGPSADKGAKVRIVR